MNPVKAEFWRLARDFIENGYGFGEDNEPRCYTLIRFINDNGGTCKGRLENSSGGSEIGLYLLELRQRRRRHVGIEQQTNA